MFGVKVASGPDDRRTTDLAACGHTATSGANLSNVDLERIKRGTALSLSGTNLVSKSINDLRILAGVGAADA